MEVNGPTAAIILALLCGGGAWLLFTIIPDTWRPARLGVTIVAALMGAANGFSHFGSNESSLERVERELIESDEVGGLASAFRRRDPAAFDQYVREIHAAMQRDGDREAALRRVGATLNAAAASRLHRLPDAGIADYYAIVRDELLELRATNAAACVPLVRGEPLNVSELRLSDGLRRRQLQIYNQAFSASETVQPAPFEGAEWETIQDDLAARATLVVGEDLQLLAPDADISGREARYCEVAAELMNQLSLTPQTARVFATLRAEQAAAN